MKLKIKVVPRSSKNEIIGPMADGTIKIKIAAAPVDNEANDALVELLSQEYKIPKSRIKIISGLKSKNKIVEIL